MPASRRCSTHWADAKVLAKDLLFATLDPTMRGLKLPLGTRAVLSDTVGFIADLPTELVAAFRATLEEVLEADVIVHVRDASHAESAAQKADVLKVLADLGVETDGERPFIEVLNKIDLVEPEVRAGLMSGNDRPGGPVAVSALSGEGLNQLLRRFEAEVTHANIGYRLTLAHADGEGLAWVYRHAQVRERRDAKSGVELLLTIPPQETARFAARLGRICRQSRGLGCGLPVNIFGRRGTHNGDETVDRAGGRVCRLRSAGSGRAAGRGRRHPGQMHRRGGPGRAHRLL